MIESIHIAGVATYGIAPESFGSLSQLNFIYGSNGSGKTTITRIIADEAAFPSCTVNWKGGNKLQAMVYNRDFVAKNFDQSTELKGIFTLGERNIDTLNKISAAKEKVDEIKSKIETLACTLEGEDKAGGKKAELVALEAAFRDKCWAQKKKHDTKLSGAFEGYRNNADKFKDKVLQEFESNSAAVKELADLEKRAGIMFGVKPTAVASISTVSTANVLAHGRNPILRKRVIGKEDVDIAAMIQRLDNSDWVRDGRAYYAANDDKCPFCQQHTTEAFTKSLNEYFNETFEVDSKAINDLEASYSDDAERLKRQIQTIIDSSPKFVDIEKLKAENALLDSKITVNLQRIAGKKKEPSQIVNLESLVDICATIGEIIEAANAQISEHNNMVRNLATEQRDLTSQVWKYLLEAELNTELAAYTRDRTSINKAISGISAQIEKLTKEKAEKIIEIRELEKATTSVQPTVDAINGLLESFGFRGFKLAKADSGSTYKLVRQDGTDAQETLSEGEKTFVTFLYFYHLLKGSDSASGMTSDRVVAIDDPISSLDSDILFIVSSLIKGLFDEVRAGTVHIKQVLVFTHNVYFHKEVSFNPKRSTEAMRDETFWVVRKSNSVSKLERHNSNPIKTSYELLWVEVRNSDRSNLTIQNTLRRILENYFKILGHLDPDDICDKFEGREKLICKSLFSWVNDGSHSAHDELYMAIDHSLVETYLAVFRRIFEKEGHLAHYKMMMGEAFIEEPVVSEEAAVQEEREEVSA